MSWSGSKPSSPPANAAPLETRIAQGRESILFGHHADYAAATTAERPGDALPAFLTRRYADHASSDRTQHALQLLLSGQAFPVRMDNDADIRMPDQQIVQYPSPAK